MVSLTLIAGLKPQILPHRASPSMGDPLLSLDDKDVEFGGAEVGEYINGILVVCELCANGEVDRAAWDKHFTVERLGDFTLF